MRLCVQMLNNASRMGGNTANTFGVFGQCTAAADNAQNVDLG